ncbi:MAG: hypothetical protein J0I41_24175 [Filimonas sp.]|nr:hypothetical protein [Filimonas sp.]
MSENNEEISLKVLILKFKEWILYLLSKWMIIGIIGIIGGCLGLLYALNKKATYSGTLTFVLSNESKGANGLASIAGQFGLDIGGGSGNGAFEGDNIIELLKSKRIIKGALFKEIPQAGDITLNIIAQDAGFVKGWNGDKRLSKHLPFPKEISKLDLIQDSLVGVIHGYIVRQSLTIAKVDKKLSFYQVSTTSSNELISVFLTKQIVDEAAKMYIDTKTKTARENLIMLQHEADSLRARLGGTIHASATQIDQTFNLNPALQTQRAPIQQNQIQAQVLGAAYGEVIKNLEIAKISLQKETPLYQIIDEPTLPLTKIRFGRLRGIVIGGFLAALFCVFMLMGSRFYKKIFEN